jgi:ABC-type multidrug transport system fused ATPase/permease subunit
VQLTVKDIKLSFAGASDKKFNFTCFGGHIYSVVGKSGAGKSTLLNIVMGIQAPRSGEVHYQHSRGSALEQVKSVFVSQDLHNMPLSVAEYVAYPDHEISSERIRSALREACVLDWVDQLTGGVDERLSFNESNLSGGQMQRLQIARVFYHRPDFIFLDEATSALDQVNEQKLLQNLRKLVSQTQAIVIMVAHRIQAIESADFKIEV